MEEEPIEESRVIHPAKKRRDERKVVTGDDINSMVSALKRKLGAKN